MIKIPLTQGKYALIDDKDYSLISKYTWCADKKVNIFYAITYIRHKGKKTTIGMHRLILGLTNRKIKSDHKDHNGLNNQRSNLRACTNSQNMQNQCIGIRNKSGYKGVSWRKDLNKWAVYIMHKKKGYYVGVYEDILEAAKAYNKRARKLFGKYACLNKV